MITRISAEFPEIEFAEMAAKRIRETISGLKKVTIYLNKNKFKISENEEYTKPGKMFVLLPAAINSANYYTGLMTREVVESQIKEPLLTKSVHLCISCESKNIHNISQIISSYGGYEIKVEP